MDELTQELLTLLDRIEVDDDPSLASQRFDIVKKYGWEIEFGEIVSSEIH